MERVQIALETALPGFSNEYADVLKLFFKLEAFWVNPEAGSEGACVDVIDPVTGLCTESLRHTHEEAAGTMRSTFVFRGQSHTLEASLPAEEADEEHHAIVLKRIRKRTSKTALYQLLKQITGHQPPWGSLTGIRPTRLVYEGLAKGLTLDAAADAVESTFDVTHEKAQLLREIVAVQQTLPLHIVAVWKNSAVK